MLSPPLAVCRSRRFSVRATVALQRKSGERLGGRVVGQTHSRRQVIGGRAEQHFSGRRLGPRRQLKNPPVDQNPFGYPACFKIAFASGLPSILAGTVKVCCE